jgi:hypothetical protein
MQMNQSYFLNKQICGESMGTNQFRKELPLRAIVIGGIWGLVVIALLGYVQLADHPFSIFTAKATTPPSQIFDPAIPENQRLTLVKNYIVGDWYQPPINDGAISHTNYSFLTDGTLKAWDCDRWGEMSERSYKPYDHDGAVHNWQVTAGRYADNGMIFYQVMRGNGLLWQYPLLLIDRGKGFVEYLPADNITKPMQRGKSSDCN